MLEPGLLLKVVCIGTWFVVRGCLYWNLVYCYRLFVLEPGLMLTVVCIGTWFIVKDCLCWNPVDC